MKQPGNSIVVAVGPDGAEAALTFAVSMAKRTRSPLHLVSVLQIPGREAFSGQYGGTVEAADEALENAVQRVRRVGGEAVCVSTERVDAVGIAAGLLMRADRGRMLVLQHRRLSRLRRLVTGSTVNAVASKAHVPVVAVPEDWAPARLNPPIITVAIRDTHEPAGLLRTALEQAELEGGKVVVLHAWWLASDFDVAVVDHGMRQDAISRTRAELGPVLDRLRVDFPLVDVELVVRHAPPAEALLDAADASSLLVVGRRHHLLPLGKHLGPVARAVLDRSACPVLMVPEEAFTLHRA